MNTTINDIRLSWHFRLGEFINLEKYPDNKPSLQDVVNMTYGCHLLLEPTFLQVLREKQAFFTLKTLFLHIFLI